MAEPLSAPYAVEFVYTRSVGPVIERFFNGLAEGRTELARRRVEVGDAAALVVAAGVVERHQILRSWPAQYGSRSGRFWILPAAERGISSTKSTDRGAL